MSRRGRESPGTTRVEPPTVISLARSLQVVGLLVAGVGFFAGVLGGQVRRELLLLALGAGIFYGARRLEARR